MKKNCLTCNSRLNGRADKKFCNEACRNEFHNHQGAKKRDAVVKKLAALTNKNYEVLTGLFSNGVFEIRKDDLECFGFSFRGITGVELEKPGLLQLCCYDFNLIMKGEKWVIRKQP